MGAKRITPAEIIEMQRLYRVYGTYAAVAAEIGRSASSVSKYVKNRVDYYKNAKNAPVVAVTPANEIKKYKELLDMGVISQGDFDAKKKQLLGL